MLIKDVFSWLVQAAPLWVGGAHEYVSYIHVIDGIGYATNGYRMHVAAIDLADGCYDPLSGGVADASRLNNKKDLKAFADKLDKISTNDITKAVYSDFSAYKNDCRTMLSHEKHICAFNALYINQALNGDKKAVINIVGIGTDSLALFGFHELGRFYVAGSQFRHLND